MESDFSSTSLLNREKKWEIQCVFSFLSGNHTSSVMLSCASSGGPTFEPVEGINQKKSTPFCLLGYMLGLWQSKSGCHKKERVY